MTDGVGEAPLVKAEVGEDGSSKRIGTPLFVIRTDLVPMADRGSSFLTLILAYISLLNFVVISAKGKHLSKKKKKKKGKKTGAILTSLGLTLFSLNLNETQHVHKKVRA